jgi:hypothetical protein
MSFSIIHSGFRMIQAPPPPPAIVDFLSWTPDPSALANGVTGYEIGIRTSANPPGTYPLIMPVEGTFTSAFLISDIIPPLPTGAYIYAVRAVGSSVGTWSTEFGFSAP